MLNSLMFSYKKWRVGNHDEIIIYQNVDSLTNIVKIQGETVCELEKLNLSEITTISVLFG